MSFDWCTHTHWWPHKPHFLDRNFAPTTKTGRALIIIGHAWIYYVTAMINLLNNLLYYSSIRDTHTHRKVVDTQYWLSSFILNMCQCSLLTKLSFIVEYYHATLFTIQRYFSLFSCFNFVSVLSHIPIKRFYIYLEKCHIENVNNDISSFMEMKHKSQRVELYILELPL